MKKGSDIAVAAEFWDILDREGKFTGYRMKRKKFNYFRAGQYHLVAHIWIKNSKGEFLVQKRSQNRMPMPGEWAATGGSVRSGENSRQAAVRELQEELGIRVKESEIRYVRRFVRKNSFTDVWYAGVDAVIPSLVLQTEEVQEAKWVSAEQLKQMIEDGRFHDYGDDYFETVFSL